MFICALCITWIGHFRNLLKLIISKINYKYFVRIIFLESRISHHLWNSNVANWSYPNYCQVIANGWQCFWKLTEMQQSCRLQNWSQILERKILLSSSGYEIDVRFIYMAYSFSYYFIQYVVVNILSYKTCFGRFLF